MKSTVPTELPPQARINNLLLPEELETSGFDLAHAGLLTWQCLVGAGSFVGGTVTDAVDGVLQERRLEWRFADDKPEDPPATQKIVGENAMDHIYWGNLLLSLYETYPRAQAADAISYVPVGPGNFARRLARRLGKPIINTLRASNARHDFVVSPGSEELATDPDLESIFYVEDVLTTGSSVSAMALAVKRLRQFHRKAPIAQSDALAMILRGSLKPVYTTGIGRNNEGPHALITTSVPRVREAFEERYGIVPSPQEQLPAHLSLPNEPFA